MIFQQRRFISTIFSLSSGFGKCGVAVIRVSGPSTKRVIQQMTSIVGDPKPRFAYYKNIHSPKRRDEILDKGLVLWFPGPNSFTGEDCCEFQVHGGTAVIRSILDALNTMQNCRPAEPGEFTRRAFHSGKLDLTAVEGLADLIHAETEMQRKQALLQANGALGQLYSRWRTQLLHSIAHFEAFIDFAEDENIEEDVIHRVQQMVTQLSLEIDQHISSKHGERIRTGVRAVIVGEPNVGKSSLLNLLCQRAVAIVTDVPGTTRDVLETSVDIGGYPMHLMDTAGLRTGTEDVVEREGMSRAKESARSADLIILLCSAESLAVRMEAKSWTMAQYITDYAARLGIDGLEGKPTVVAINKMDLMAEDLIKSPSFSAAADKPSVVGLSCKTSAGMSEIIARIEAELKLM